MDAFGEAENLQQAVRFALDSGVQNSPSSFKIEEGTIRVYDKTQGFGPYRDIEHYATFEDLFNPEDGYLKDFDREMDFSVCRYVIIPTVWDSKAERRDIGYIEADQIKEIQRKAVEESFAKDYSSEKFRELYEELVN